ncbi:MULTISPECIES: hypothetical protein [unclassified Novosphingobium]|uniref:hypothetical protein n=1 Tax=unclassified Novosphingobium TaxID=2644732 RepID=UPI0025CE0081|nr:MULTISPECIES: hypothetical protein [unclassified Novosphingobium]MDR6706769.1 hypothetical protein [Novosphingobium sp. 1748]
MLTPPFGFPKNPAKRLDGSFDLAAYRWAFAPNKGLGARSITSSTTLAHFAAHFRRDRHGFPFWMARPARDIFAPLRRIRARACAVMLGKACKIA